MLTPELFKLLNDADEAERDRAHKELAQAPADRASFEVVVATLASAADDRVAFWCLDSLVKKFGSMLEGEGTRLFSLLLSQLSRNHTVIDRAAWALKITSKTTTPLLLEAIRQAPNLRLRGLYIYVLGRCPRPTLQHYLGEVLALIQQYLADPEIEIRSSALDATMDLGTVESWPQPRRLSPLFEALYAPARLVAQELLVSSPVALTGRYYQSRQEDALRQIKLIDSYWDEKHRHMEARRHLPRT